MDIDGDWPPLPPPPSSASVEDESKTKKEPKMIRGRVIRPPPGAPGADRSTRQGTAKVIRLAPPKPKTTADSAAGASDTTATPSTASSIASRRDMVEKALALAQSREIRKSFSGDPKARVIVYQSDSDDEESADSAASPSSLAVKRPKHKRQVSIPPPPPPPLAAAVMQPPPATSAGTTERRRPKLQGDLASAAAAAARARSTPASVPEEPSDGIESIPPPPSMAVPEIGKGFVATESVSVRKRFEHARNVSVSGDFPSISRSSTTDSIPPPPPAASLSRPSEPPPPPPTEADTAGHSAYGIDSSGSSVPLYSCHLCKRHILEGSVVQVEDNCFHEVCFMCFGRCKRSLIGQTFYTHNGLPYCQRDYELLFSPQCSACGAPVLNGIGTDHVVFHPQCLKCCMCKKQATDDLLVSSGGIGFYFNAQSQVFCDACYKRTLDQVKPTCAAPDCNKPIDGEAALVLGKQYHLACVKCAHPSCGMQLGQTAGSEVKSHVYVSEGDGKFYCKLHLNQEPIATCSGCLQGISQDHSGLKVSGYMFHKECLSCQQCQSALYKGAGVFVDHPAKPLSESERKTTQIRVFCQEHRHLTMKAQAQRIALESQALLQPKGSTRSPDTPAAQASSPAEDSKVALGRCSLCARAVLADGRPALSIANKRFHVDCVQCEVCHCVFPNGKGIYPHPASTSGTSFLCKQHYIAHTSEKCTKCGEYIVSGRMVSVGPEHFHAACYDQPIPGAMRAPSTAKQ